MNILALDTSSVTCSLALCLDETIVALDQPQPLQQAQVILPSIQDLLAEHQVSLKDLNAIAFGCGPGSFTGVRIATSIAQGLAYALNLPIIPISSLAGLAQAAYDDLGWSKLLVAVDARIQEIYWGAYEVNTNGLVELVGEEKVIKPTDLIINKTKDWCCVGDGWRIYQSMLSFNTQHQDASRLPSARGIAKLAREKYIRKEMVTPAEALPVYLRNNVATVKK